MMAEKKHDLESFPLVSSLVRAGIDPLKVLTDVGFEIPAEKLRLSQQLLITLPISKNNPKSDGTEKKPEPEPGKKPEHEKTPERKLIDQRHDAFKKTETWLEEMIKGQPAIVVKAALIWLGQDYCRKKIRGSNRDVPEWVLLYYDGEKLFHGYIDIKINYSNMQDKLLSCLRDYPERTIKSLSILSQVYEIGFDESNYYATLERLEGFLNYHHSRWRRTVIRNKALGHLTKAAEQVYLGGSAEQKTKVLAFLIKVLEFYFHSSGFEIDHFREIVCSWQKIAAMDKSFFVKYTKIYTLKVAAGEVCRNENIKSKLEIAEAIDTLTDFQYLNPTKRRAVFNEIARRYILRTPGKIKSEPQSYTLSEDEWNTLDKICVRLGISKMAAIDECITFADKVRKKDKKYLEKSVEPLFQRTKCKNTSFRVSSESIQLLPDIASSLNKLKATKGKNVSKSAALGWAFKIYAAGLDLDPLGYTGKPISNSQIAEKVRKRR